MKLSSRSINFLQMIATSQDGAVTESLLDLTQGTKLIEQHYKN